MTSADDAFGLTIGSETIGLYNSREVRGFSPIAAGNTRIDGLYLDLQVNTPRVYDSTTIRVGLSAQGYVFPAPTGIVDYSLKPTRPPGRSVVLTAGPFSSLVAEGELRAGRKNGRLSGFAGVGLSKSNLEFGASAPIGELAAVVSWRPLDELEIKPFAATFRWKDDDQPFLTFVDGNHLPPRVKRGRYLGQGWGQDGQLDTMGVIVNAQPAPRLQLRAGLFRWRRALQGDFADLFLDTSAAGVSNHIVVASPDQNSSAVSGELRASYSIAEGPRRHILTASLRGRRVQRAYDGSVELDLGEAVLGTRDAVAKPDFDFAERSHDLVRQSTLGAAYELRWPEVGELGFGLQKSTYSKRVTLPGADPVRTRAKPLLWYATVAVYASSKLAFYGGYTRGLEETGVAPVSAINRGAALPASRTKQQELGLRYILSPETKLIVGLFQIEKPHLELDSTGLFGPAGTVRHRGLETSLSSEPLKGLHLVGGLVLLDPRISGEAVDADILGSRPTGLPRRTLRLNMDYRFPRFDRLSLDAAIRSDSSRPASSDGRLKIPARTLLDLGLRYRFPLGRAAASVRAQLTNVFNTFGWDVLPGSAFMYIPQRSFYSSLAVDF